MDIDNLRQYLDNIKALEDAMRFVVQSSDDKSVWRFSSYKEFMRKYNEIAIKVSKELPYDGLYDIYDLEKVPHWASTVADTQKNYFHLVLANIAILKSLIENKLNVKNDEIINLKNFFISNLRRAILHDVDGEIYIQDVIEQLLIGKGLNKGIDYDREVGRVKVSIKEVKPDFIFPKLSLALEVKLSKTKLKAKEIVDEINADIQAYSKEYKQILFLVYDMGTIRDETEFKNDIDNKDNIQVVIIKH
ncbi:MAG: hypothetical protein HJHJAOHD_02693 [Flavobacteriales bacterium]|nr:hypothetical protein [Flavobacteriales bacterium]WKZ76114.1 MAG: hypothetical protein QY303_04295 [Vicingaceae bacterium]